MPVVWTLTGTCVLQHIAPPPLLHHDLIPMPCSAVAQNGHQLHCYANATLAAAAATAKSYVLHSRRLEERDTVLGKGQLALIRMQDQWYIWTRSVLNVRLS